MASILEIVHDLVWGIPALVLILGVGLYLSLRTGFAQIRLFPRALGAFFDLFRREKTVSGVSPMQALCTALAATVGTGNIAGVAGAIAIGGPGAIFWMWICALIGMVTKFAEATLAVHYRVRHQGEYWGGPMYMITRGLGKRWRFLAVVYAFFGIVAAFGVGNATQINAVITGVHETIFAFGGTPRPFWDLLLGVLLAVLLTRMLSGGARGIGRAAEALVPFAAAAYLLLGLLVLIARAQEIPQAFSAIFRGAFDPQAATGGFVGSMFTTLRIGVSRGVFTNEAGMGTAGIAHAGADVVHPAQQGLMGIMEVFLDTIVICTMTALVILVSGVPIPYGTDPGAALTATAFSSVCGKWVTVVITAALGCFAFATVLGWGLYGIRCVQFLFGEEASPFFVKFQALAVVLGAVLNTGTVWLLSETVNGLMAIPNLIALAALSNQLVRLTKDYIHGGTYEDFHQCQSLRTLSHAEIPSPGGESQGSRKEDLPSEHRSA